MPSRGINYNFPANRLGKDDFGPIRDNVNWF